MKPISTRPRSNSIQEERKITTAKPLASRSKSLPLFLCPQIQKLPNEMTKHILNYLSGKDIVNFILAGNKNSWQAIVAREVLQDKKEEFLSRPIPQPAPRIHYNDDNTGSFHYYKAIEVTPLQSSAVDCENKYRFQN